jgi:hypothetical protein
MCQNQHTVDGVCVTERINVQDCELQNNVLQAISNYK